jgi:MFS-type transporter involved in bile tolerance (Atg22 family)
VSPLNPLREEDLGHALREIALHPERNLLPAWSWKAAGMSALLRAATFYATNLRAGRYDAVRAGLVEAVFAVFAAGLLGATSQRLRLAKPIWATAIVVWLAMPLGMLLAQFGVHKLAHTPHLGTGLTLSFCFAAIASSFSWYAMRHGALLGGDASTSLVHDVRHLPRIIVNYVLAVPRALLRRARVIRDK